MSQPNSDEPGGEGIIPCPPCLESLSRLISVKDAVMKGSVWGSLKCTSTMDKLNQIAMSDKTLQYYYKGDQNIPIGVLGMVDDTLGVSICGQSAIRKNAVINSFMETQRLKLSKETRAKTAQTMAYSEI